MSDLAAVVAALAKRVEALEARPLTLDQCGETLTRADIGRLLGKAARTMDRLVTIERQSGIRLLPDPLPGVPNRYHRDAVRRWMQRGGTAALEPFMERRPYVRRRGCAQ